MRTSIQLTMMYVLIKAYGEIANAGVRYLRDVHGNDLIIFSLLTAAILVIGIYPNILLNLFHTTVANLLHLSLQSKLPS